MTTMDTNMAPTSKSWNIGLWAAQVALAAMFLMAGFMKLTTSPADLAGMGMLWAENAPAALILFIGAVEVLGAIGVILPAATRIMPKLTQFAALGLATIMVLASCVHIYRGEYEVLPVNLVFFALAVFVAWGRSKKAPIARRA